MDIGYLLALQHFREGSDQFLRDFLMEMTGLTDKSTDIMIVAIIYWCVSKTYGSWLWLGWSTNRLVNGFLINTATGASCNVTSTTLLAGSEGCINKSIYKN